MQTTCLHSPGIRRAAMKSGWEIFVVVVWFPVFVVLTDVFDGGGSIIALVLLPLVWILWVNLCEHWWHRDDRDGE
jgi:hypothetical protein